MSSVIPYIGIPPIGTAPTRRNYCHRYRHARAAITFALLLTVVACTLIGCADRPMRRPVTTLNLGEYSQYTQPFTYRDDLDLVIFRDERGLSFMSTACTYDLSYLRFEPGKDKQPPRFVSMFSSSKYSQTGEVLEGPTKFPLPYYRARLAEGKLGGPRTNIYVELPTEVGKDWRLAPPVAPPLAKP